jgi:hypothetical protein
MDNAAAGPAPAAAVAWQHVDTSVSQLLTACCSLDYATLFVVMTITDVMHADLSCVPCYSNCCAGAAVGTDPSILP